MKTCVIIAEFNPFHNGHKYLLDCARESGFTHIITVMSGNFVQRGEPAVYPASQRIEDALKCGADLVIQLPVTSVLTSAQGFARGGVCLAEATGIADALVFGSECGDITRITKTAKIINSPEYAEKLRLYLKEGITYASASEKALADISPGCSEIMSYPNNILGAEYCAALMKSGSQLTPVTIKRAENNPSNKGQFASASQIRQMIYSGEDILPYIPPEISSNSYKNIVSLNKYENAVLYKMRTVSLEEIAGAPDVSEGIENRIFTAAQKAQTLEELYSLIKTKRYTRTRIQRIIANLTLGITAEESGGNIEYLRVLGISGKGTELLKLMKEKATLPVISKTADFKTLSQQANKMFELECRATDIYALISESSLPSGIEKSRTPIIL